MFAFGLQPPRRSARGGCTVMHHRIPLYYLLRSSFPLQSNLASGHRVRFHERTKCLSDASDRGRRRCHFPV